MEESTIELARRGDRNALATILREFQDVWYRMSLGLLRDAELARDATQETALRVMKQLPAFRGESQLRTWSLGIAINVCREIRRRDRPVDGLRLVGMRQEEDGPMGEAEMAESRGRIREMLTELPERQREAVMLRFFEELSVEEAAEAMQCAPGTVKATIHQALKAMKKKFEVKQ
ncbi:MAG TPA: RNA polymerase sigma factor [Tepidisphaeraceae bacterium]|nr:RNA polymerase sigma factor [Tepidisphaeraceae bacterium]